MTRYLTHQLEHVSSRVLQTAQLALHGRGVVEGVEEGIQEEM